MDNMHVAADRTMQAPFQILLASKHISVRLDTLRHHASDLVVPGLGRDCSVAMNLEMNRSPEQWRRQHLLRGGAKIEIMPWGTHGGLRGRVQQLLDD